MLKLEKGTNLHSTTCRFFGKKFFLLLIISLYLLIRLVFHYKYLVSKGWCSRVTFSVFQCGKTYFRNGLCTWSHLNIHHRSPDNKMFLYFLTFCKCHTDQMIAEKFFPVFLNNGGNSVKFGIAVVKATESRTLMFCWVMSWFIIYFMVSLYLYQLLFIGI